MLEIIPVRDGMTLTLNIKGRLDTTTAPDLEKYSEELKNETDRLILDFIDLQYISSAGLRVLLSFQKIMVKKEGMIIRNVFEPIMEIFEVTGFTDILNIEPIE